MSSPNAKDARRLRSGVTPSAEAVAIVTRAVESTLADPDLWRVRTEDAILRRYEKAGFPMRSLAEIGETVPVAVADKLALVGARPTALPRQLRNRRRFRGRLEEEVVQLVRAACSPLVHNGAVYGYRADRATAVPILAGALDPAFDDEPSLILALARAKHEAGLFTGVRPLYGDFNAWYLNRVSRTSRTAFRERFVRDHPA